jgi:hypothetical protein
METEEMMKLMLAEMKAGKEEIKSEIRTNPEKNKSVAKRQEVPAEGNEVETI